MLEGTLGLDHSSLGSYGKEFALILPEDNGEPLKGFKWTSDS